MRQIQLEPGSPGRTLAALAGSIAESQAALLAHRLPEFERGIARQMLLCQELRPGKAAITDPDGISKSEVARVQAQARLLAAVLRRMRENLSALQNARQGLALTYSPATAAMYRRN